jgi:subtilisin family serine protease
MAADRLLALPDPAQIATFLSAVSAIGARAVPIIPDILYRVELTSRHADSVPDALAALSGVRYAEPDYIVHALLSPNDPKYLDGTLWGLHNTGQSSGLDDADIDAPEGWDTRHSAPDVIVGVIDTGVRYTHEDIAANMWINPGETGTDALGRDKRSNGIDDDGNGYVDDVHGINAITGTGNPLDD